MSSEIELKLVLPDKYAIEKIKKDDILSRYYKDEFSVRETFSEYYDSSDWALSHNDFILRVRNTGGRDVAALKQGKIDNLSYPGLFSGQQWLCYWNGADTIVSDMLARSAPFELADIAKDKELGVCFTSKYTRQFTTLYMPDRVCIELSLDEGTIICDGKSEQLYEIGLELLYGNTGTLINLSNQLIELFGFQPELLTKQQRALRLIRSR